MSETRRALPRKAISTGIKLLVISLAVGLGLSALGISARDVLGWLGGTVGEAVGVGANLLEWAWSYVILGAAIVLPIWLILAAVRHLQRRK